MSLAPKFSLQIDTRWCLDALLKAGRITQRDANLIATTSRRKEQITWHPLQFIADFNLTDQANPTQKLSLPVLTQWLAEQAGLPVWRIDPLKTNVPAVTAIMSPAN